MIRAALAWQQRVRGVDVDMRRRAPKSKMDKKRGQGVVEFALVSIIFLNMFLLTLNGVLAFTTQQYISYATFMAARAFQASHETFENGQRAAAQATLNKYLTLVYNDGGKELARITNVYIPNAVKEVPYGYKAPERASQIRVEFEVPLVQLPLGDLKQSFGYIKLEAVSYLGREPTVSECRNFFKAFYNHYGTGGIGWSDKGMDDNNC